ncbi:SUI1 domain [Sesbania bispinosa]|nr:SUI1 domain [Sesbania bispinosa]
MVGRVARGGEISHVRLRQSCAQRREEGPCHATTRQKKIEATKGGETTAVVGDGERRMTEDFWPPLPLSSDMFHMEGLSNLVGGIFCLGELSFMSELDAQIPTAFDPFAEANADDSGAGSKDYVHIRIQQRNGRKSLTTVQGLKKEFSYNKILKDLKKEFCCNGTVVQDPELGQVIQLQGDQRKNVSTFLVQAGIVKKDHIKIHGF